ncbi:MAG: phasin family protein [Rhodobacteraceae bacterium]|nr:phasin family protein [Paracoccaceae bacterium]
MANAKPKFPFMPGMAPVADPAHVGDMMQGMMRAQARIMDALLRQNIEALDFLKARYEKDRALCAALAAAEDAQAAAKAWTEFLRRATSDYADEAGRMSALAAVTAEQVIEGVTDEVKAATGDAPRKGKA